MIPLFNRDSLKIQALEKRAHDLDLGVIRPLENSPHAELVKKFFWKTIQLALFDFDTTTKLNTEQINKISDVIIKFFGDRGIVIEFPSEEYMNKNNFDN